MHGPRIHTALIAVLAVTGLLAHGKPAFAQPRRSELIRERLKTRPDDPTLYYYLALAEFAEGNRPGGLEALEKVADLGHGFLPVRGMGFDAVWGDSAFQNVRGRLEKKLPRVTSARELFRLDRQLIPEGIAWDPQSRCYFVGSVAASRIIRIDARGKVSDFAVAGELRQVLGLALDAGRRRLHAVSTTLVEGARDSVSNRVVTYDLATGARVRSVAVPAATQLNDVTVAASGELYTTDSGAGGVYRIRESGVVDTLVATGRLPGVNGVAISSDGTGLYLAHSTGIARFEFATGELLPRIEVPPGETIAAIDGLYADGHTLIGIQNVTNPGRVIRIHLRADGKGAERIETLLSHHHPAIDEPTTGVIVGRSFALLATTQVARFKPDGTLESPETLKRPVALMVSLAPKR